LRCRSGTAEASFGGHLFVGLQDPTHDNKARLAEVAKSTVDLSDTAIDMTRMFDQLLLLASVTADHVERIVHLRHVFFRHGAVADLIISMDCSIWICRDVLAFF
jgi:hypothetical protein